MIDRATIDKIMDATNIVDVVSEFVTLRKTGVNYKGLCPFHDDKTPSFIVSPSKGICHCFACGKGGNAVNFIMEHEQMTYVEALRWLANKYHIEIRERELTSQEREEQSKRESMFIVNEWADGYFQDLLHNHADGLAIGMQYFRSRGFRDDVIRDFHLGFDLTDRLALGREALKKGYREEFLLSTGICYKNDRGELIAAMPAAWCSRGLVSAARWWASPHACWTSVRRESTRNTSTRPTATSITRTMSCTASGRPRRPSPRTTACSWWRDRPTSLQCTSAASEMSWPTRVRP